ncbi:MAG: hypothetical protein ACYCOR_04280 [Acidobacteriaceae bacterium]
MRAVASFPPLSGPSIPHSRFSTLRTWIGCYLLFAFGVLQVSFVLLPSASGQQTQLKRYDVYVGFADLNSPALGLNQTGLHTQFGVNERRWYALGFDYSVGSGSTVLKPTCCRALFSSNLLLSSRPIFRRASSHRLTS